MFQTQIITINELRVIGPLAPLILLIGALGFAVLFFGGFQFIRALLTRDSVPSAYDLKELRNQPAPNYRNKVLFYARQIELHDKSISVRREVMKEKAGHFNRGLLLSVGGFVILQLLTFAEGGGSARRNLDCNQRTVAIIQRASAPSRARAMRCRGAATGRGHGARQGWTQPGVLYGRELATRLEHSRPLLLSHVNPVFRFSPVHSRLAKEFAPAASYSRLVWCGLRNGGQLRRLRPTGANAQADELEPPLSLVASNQNEAQCPYPGYDSKVPLHSGSPST